MLAVNVSRVRPMMFCFELVTLVLYLCEIILRRLHWLLYKWPLVLSLGDDKARYSRRTFSPLDREKTVKQATEAKAFL